MKTKWYAFAPIVVLIFLGIFHDNTTVPNQEIVIEFVDSKTAKEDIENTIYSVKEKLLDAGASNIKVQETKSGALKISYYSIVNVDNIKKVLSEDNLLALNNHQPTNHNKEQNENSSLKLSNYNIDVYELDIDTDISNFDGNSIIEIKYDSQRFSTPQNYAYIENILIIEANKVFKTAYKFNKSHLILEDNTLHLKPEVRAGPIS